MVEGWFFIAAALLIVSGGWKLVDPAPTSGALSVAGVPDRPFVVVVVAVVEIGAGVAGTVWGGWASVAVAIVYVGFAAFVGYALARRLPLSSCGCFGRPDTPPTWGHLVFNLVSAAAGVGVAASGTVPIDVLADQPLAGVPYLAFVAMGVWVVYLLLAELPATLRASRPV